MGQPEQDVNCGKDSFSLVLANLHFTRISHFPQRAEFSFSDCSDVVFTESFQAFLHDRLCSCLRFDGPRFASDFTFLKKKKKKYTDRSGCGSSLAVLSCQ